MGNVLFGCVIGFAVGVSPQARGLVYAGYARAKLFAKRQGWIA